MLLRSGDLAGFARRLWRRLVALLNALGRLGGPMSHAQWRERRGDPKGRAREGRAGRAAAPPAHRAVSDGHPAAHSAPSAPLAPPPTAT